MRNKTILILCAVLIVAISGIYFLVRENSKPGKLDGFAQCLKDKGAVFYGAFWCPHCQNQKQMFGSSVKFLSYVECSTADGKSQLQACKAKNIEGYPTWEFIDESRLTGEIPLTQLSEKTSCELPQ